MDTDNLIDTLRLELSLPDTWRDDNPSRHLDTLVDDAVVPVLERVVDEYGRRDIAIESMEIDLGDVREEDLPEALERELRRRLEDYSFQSEPFLLFEETSDNQPDESLQAGTASRLSSSSPLTVTHTLQEMEHYLENQSVPWDAGLDNFDPAVLLEPLFRDIEGAESLIRRLWAPALARLVRILESVVLKDAEGFDSVKDTLEELSGSVPPAIIPDSFIEGSTVASGDVPEDAPEKGSAFLRKTESGDSSENAGEVYPKEEPETVIKAVLSADDPAAVLYRSSMDRLEMLDPVLASRVKAIRKRWLSYLAARRESGYAPDDNGRLLDRQGVATVPQDIESAADRFPGDWDMPDSRMTPPTSGIFTSSGVYNPDIPDRVPEEHTVEMPFRNHEGKDAVEVILEEEKRRTKSESREVKELMTEGTELADAGDAGKATDGNVPVNKGDKTGSEGKEDVEEEEAAEGEKDVKEDEEVFLDLMEIPASEEAPFWDEEVPEPVRIPISDAGLVLVHPFIPRFLHNLGLTDERGRFLSTPSRVYAAHILRDIAGLDAPHFDHNLMLEKILCGFSPESLLPEEWELDEKEQAEVQELLEAIRSYWPPLANSSVQALQKAFLQRSGTIERLGESYLVRVESSAMDILLDDLPWECSIILLPWLENPIIVEWQR
jgi:hypothetical protein